MASSSRATTSEGPKYQGYPYVNLPAFGVPTIDSQTASRYANLPRRPLGTPVRVQEGSSGTPSYQETTKSDSDDEPVLYIDLPGDDENDMYVREDSNPNQEQRIPIQTQPKKKDEDEQVVYIDLPECSGSGVSDRRPEGGSSVEVYGAQDQRLPIQTQPRRKDEDEQVVYIDLPESSSSGIRPEDGPSTSVVQDTIFYDQFKNRWIVMSQASGANSAYSPSPMSPLERPTTLSLWTPQGPDSPSVVNRPYPSQTPNQLFLNTPADDFRLPPLPLKDHPDPPPAYSEIDLRSPESRVSSVVPAATEPNVSPETPERTRVIVHHQTNGRVNTSRKVLTCKYCMVTVNSLMVRQVTYETHLVAFVCFSMAMIPCIPLIYCCDVCKSDVYYCPICNNRITKEFKFC